LIAIVKAPPGRTVVYRVTYIEEWTTQPIGLEYPSIQTGVVVATGDTPPVSRERHALQTGDTPPVSRDTKVIPLRKSPQGTPTKGEAPPQFEPVPRELYRREYDGMIADAERAIKATKGDDRSYIRDMRDDSAELIVWLRKEKRDGWEMKVQEIERNPNFYQRTSMKPNAAAIVSAWQSRIEEIKRAMNGVKN
jgi:hypothetical protein